ncbi:methyltransferase [Streptomyces coffeae]|nr:methyltransferase [Streptomyces coffeae]
MSDELSLTRGYNLLRMNADTENRDSTFTLSGREYELLEGVFSPTLCPSTEIYAEWLPYPAGGSFLEIGAGAGVISVTAALSGCARVTALDINETAVENTRRNVARHGVADRVHVLHSDMYSALDRHTRFDLVFWSSSFIEPSTDFAHETPLHHAIFDPGYVMHQEFLRSAADHLEPGGRLLLGYSNMGNRELLTEVADNAGLRFEQLHAAQHPHLADVEYQLLEFHVADRPAS